MKKLWITLSAVLIAAAFCGASYAADPAKPDPSAPDPDSAAEIKAKEKGEARDKAIETAQTDKDDVEAKQAKIKSKSKELRRAKEDVAKDADASTAATAREGLKTLARELEDLREELADSMKDARKSAREACAAERDYLNTCHKLGGCAGEGTRWCSVSYADPVAIAKAKAAKKAKALAKAAKPAEPYKTEKELGLEGPAAAPPAPPPSAAPAVAPRAMASADCDCLPVEEVAACVRARFNAARVGAENAAREHFSGPKPVDDGTRASRVPPPSEPPAEKVR